jgi:hypothetical protein
LSTLSLLVVVVDGAAAGVLAVIARHQVFP